MIVANGSTDVTTYFVLRDSTTHVPKTDVTVTDIDLYYCEQGEAMAAKADATALAAADSAHGDNQAFHCGQGLYRIDWPDAAFDGGVGKRVYLIVVCSGVDTEIREVELSPLGTAQTGDSYAIVASETHGNAALKAIMDTSGVTLANDAITAAKIADDAISSEHINTGAITADAFAADAIVAATLATGAITAAKFAAGAIDAAAIANGAIDAATFAADVDAEIRTMVWNAPTADYGSAGTYGEALEAVGAAADPWLTNLPGEYGEGTAGYIIGTGSTLTASAIADAVWDEASTGHTDAGKAGAQLWTDIDAIKGRTDRIPDAVAGEAGGLFIAGANAATTLASITCTGALTISDGVIATASTANRTAITVTGNGTGNGLTIGSGSGATGTGVSIVSNATNGIGLAVAGKGNLHGVRLSAGGGIGSTGLHIHQSGTFGGGVFVEASGGANHGVQITGGIVGVELQCSEAGGVAFGTLAYGAGSTATWFQADAVDGKDFVIGDGVTNGAIFGDITGNLSGSVGSVAGAVGSVTGAVGSVTGAVGSVTQKTGFKLAADGLDSITNTEPTGLPTNFREKILLLYRRFFKKVTRDTAAIRHFSDAGAVTLIQDISDTGGVETQGAARQADD